MREEVDFPMRGLRYVRHRAGGHFRLIAEEECASDRDEN